MDKDYIKRSDALEQLESIDWYHVNRNGKLVSGATSHDDPFVRYDAVEEMLKALPAAADVVPVVRCKDCEWWTKQEASIQGRCDRLGMYPTGEWFCANGRKEKKGDQ